MSDSTPIAHEIAGKLGRFLRGRVLIAGVLVVFHVLGFYMIDLPWWGLSGVLVGALTLVPVFGFLAGAVVATVVTMLAGGDVWSVVWLLVVMFLGQMLEGLYLTPKILGKELALNPLLVFALVMLGAIFFGPVGALLAAPVAAVVMLVWRRRSGQAPV